MKTFTKVILVLFLVLTSQFSFAQWTPTNFTGSSAYISFTATNSNIYIIPGIEGRGLCRSTDFGMNWTQLTFQANIIKSFNNDLYASTSMFSGYGGGLYRSTNEGVNWTLIGFNNHSINAIEVTSTSIFVNTDTGFYRSSNIGVSWTKIAIIDNTISSIASSGLNIYAGAKGLIYRSTNNGVNWTSFNSGLPSNIWFNRITVSGSNIFICGLDSTASSNGGIFKSTDNGQSWTNIGLTDKRVTALFASGYNLFAGTGLGGVYLTTNAGVTWIQKNQGLTNIWVTSIIVFGDYVLASCFEGTPRVWRRFLLDIIGIQKISSEVPDKYSLHQNYPNPFNPSTTINYEITKNENVTLKIFDLLGHHIATLVNEKQSPGIYSVNWNASKHSSGVYFYRIESANYRETKSMLLVK